MKFAMYLLYILSVLAVIAVIAITAKAFIGVDSLVTNYNAPHTSEEVIYGHRVGPGGQEMLITQR